MIASAASSNKYTDNQFYIYKYLKINPIYTSTTQLIYNSA
jgi:hypothetical protein